jgi:hypothetical protein
MNQTAVERLVGQRLARYEELERQLREHNVVERLKQVYRVRPKRNFAIAPRNSSRRISMVLVLIISPLSCVRPQFSILF